VPSQRRVPRAWRSCSTRAVLMRVLMMAMMMAMMRVLLFMRMLGLKVNEMVVVMAMLICCLW